MLGLEMSWSCGTVGGIVAEAMVETLEQGNAQQEMHVEPRAVAGLLYVSWSRPL
jgi:hypothetical protein